LTRTLMLTYALTLVVLAGSAGIWWTIILPLPHLLIWAWLTLSSDLSTIEPKRDEFKGE